MKLKRKEGKEAILLAEQPKAEWKTFLAFIDKKGKILQEGEEIKMSIPPNEYLPPFELEEEENCPYGYLSIGSKKIFCYNFSLSVSFKIDIPLNNIKVYGTEKTGKNYKIWVIGKPEKANKSFCKIYDLKEKKWQEVNFSIEKFYQNIILDIKKLEGILEKDSIDFYSIEEDISNSTIDFIDSVDEKIKREDMGNIKRKHFFFCSLNSKGDIFIKKIKLVFEIGTAEDVLFDEEEGIVKFPPIYEQEKLIVYKIKDSFLFINEAVNAIFKKGNRESLKNNCFSF